MHNDGESCTLYLRIWCVPSHPVVKPWCIAMMYCDDVSYMGCMMMCQDCVSWCDDVSWMWILMYCNDASYIGCIWMSLLYSCKNQYSYIHLCHVKHFFFTFFFSKASCQFDQIFTFTTKTFSYVSVLLPSFLLFFNLLFTSSLLSLVHALCCLTSKMNISLIVFFSFLPSFFSLVSIHF